MIKEIMQYSEPLENFSKVQKHFSVNPGPGYYYDQRSASSFKQIRYPEFKQNFQINNIYPVSKCNSRKNILFISIL